MATLNQKYPTLVDIATAMDPDGSIGAVAEVLSQQNPVLEDIPFFEGNLPLGHRSIIRTGLPTAVFRKFYQGVAPSKSTRTPVVDATCMIEARNQIDKDEAELNGNSNAFRLDEGRASIEAMNQKMATALFYGDSTLNPEQFHGLAPRYSALPVATAPISANVIDGGGRGADNTSLWLIGWGRNSIFGIYPKGSKAGLESEDLGLIDVLDADGNPYRAYANRWVWKPGLVVKDWRFGARICNVDVSDLAGQGAADLVNLSIDAFYKIKYRKMARMVWYCNTAVAAVLHKQALEKAKYQLRIDNVGGEEVVKLHGYPVRVCDAILNSEAAVA